MTKKNTDPLLPILIIIIPVTQSVLVAYPCQVDLQTLILGLWHCATHADILSA